MPCGTLLAGDGGAIKPARRLTARVRVPVFRVRSGWCVDVDQVQEILGVPLARFAERYLRSLLTWDIITYFSRNSDVVVDADGLAERLGRPARGLAAELDRLCEDRILLRTGRLYGYRPSPEMADLVEGFLLACEERRPRLALIALVVHRSGSGTI